MIDWMRLACGFAPALVTGISDLKEEGSEPTSWPTGFGYMVAAYVAVWVILMAYFWLLSRRADRLSQRLETLLEQEAS